MKITELPTGAGATVRTGGAKKSGELGEITGTCGAAAGNGNVVTGDAEITVTGAVVFSTTTGGDRKSVV